MPIYIYRCDSCGVQFEKQQGFNEAALTRCPECNRKSLHKVYQPVGIVFKGSGFYSTDHRSSSGAGRSSAHDKKNADDSNSHTAEKKEAEVSSKVDKE